MKPKTIIAIIFACITLIGLARIARGQETLIILPPPPAPIIVCTTYAGVTTCF